MLIKEAIVLAGGLGTRLRSEVPDLPKCMAEVAGKPFISYVIDFYQGQGITKFIFSLGYKHETIEYYLQKNYTELQYETVIEPEPLGTGGAILLACKKASEQTVLILNGDTLFKVNLEQLFSFHSTKKSDCTLSLKNMFNFERYGVVRLNKDDSIASFEEKNFYSKGYINGGVYALSVPQFLKEDLSEKFSFEKDYLERMYAIRRMYGLVQDGYFIDIGIPEDYHKAQKELK